MSIIMNTTKWHATVLIRISLIINKIEHVYFPMSFLFYKLPVHIFQSICFSVG